MRTSVKSLKLKHVSSSASAGAQPTLNLFHYGPKLSFLVKQKVRIYTYCWQECQLKPLSNTFSSGWKLDVAKTFWLIEIKCSPAVKLCSIKNYNNCRLVLPRDLHLIEFLKDCILNSSFGKIFKHSWHKLFQYSGFSKSSSCSFRSR